MSVRAHAILSAFGEEQKKLGFFEGLQVAEKIVGWLTREPDNEWQAEVRSWAERAIEKAKEQYDKEA